MGRKGSSSSSAAGGGASGAGEWEALVDPRRIRFTHAKIRPFFSDGKVVVETLQAIEQGRLRVEDLPKITIIQHGEEQYYSLNNRRLWVLKQCCELGLLKDNVVAVRVRPLPKTKRLQNKFDPARCCDTARFMKEKVAVRGATKPDDDSDGSDDDDSGHDDGHEHEHEHEQPPRQASNDSSAIEGRLVEAMQQTLVVSEEAAAAASRSDATSSTTTATHTKAKTKAKAKAKSKPAAQPRRRRRRRGDDDDIEALSSDDDEH